MFTFQLSDLPMLNADELKHGPGPRLAFLPSLNAQSLAEVMVAFANTEGGIIVLGLETNGQPSSEALSEERVQKTLQTAENLFNPGIVIEEWEELDLEDDFFESEATLLEGRIVIPANPPSTPVQTSVPFPVSESVSAPVVPSPSLDGASTATRDKSSEEALKEKTSTDPLKIPAESIDLLAMSEAGGSDEGTEQTAPSAASSSPESTSSQNHQEIKPAVVPSASDGVSVKTDETAVSKPAPDGTGTDGSKTASAAETLTGMAPVTVVAASAAEPVALPSSESLLISAPRPTPAPETVVEASAAPTESSPKPPPPTLFGVRIPRSIELHALNDGRVLIRSGARNRPLGGQEILRLASAKGTGEFEAEIVPGASQADFSRRLIDEYLMKRAERTKRPFSGSIDDMLLEIGALTPDRLPTTAGILLFSEYPQKWLPQSSVVFARFIGTQPRGESGMAGYIRREEITGPLPRLIEAAWNLVWSEMAVSAVVSGLEREEKAEYPQFAVREAIVNSICHRDYRLRGRRIELRMYSDRLEVISPGGLPGFITVENIKDEHFSRNPRIVNGLFQWGYIEELGLGIDRMIEVMEQAGREPPYFDARPYSFAVTLNNEREKQRPLDWIRSATHRQSRAMQYIREHGSITNREYRILCAGVSAETLRLDLAGMVDRGQLIKVGSKKGTHYILRDRDEADSESLS